MAKRNFIPEFVMAAMRGQFDTVAQMLGSGHDANEADSGGRTGLHCAAIKGDVKIVRLLLSAGANPNAIDSQNWTPLHFAAQSNALEVAAELIASGAAIDAVDSNGNTPLSNAVFESTESGEMIQLLLKHGADRMKRNDHGVSPLDLARSIANYDVARWFDS